MDNNIKSKIESMLKHHKMVLGKQKQGEYYCPAHGGCGLPVANLTYKLDKLGRNSLWALCKKHGWVAIRLNPNLNAPNVGKQKLKSKKNKLIQERFI